MEIDVPTCLSGRGQRALWDGKSFDALVSPRTRKKTVVLVVSTIAAQWPAQ